MSTYTRRKHSPQGPYNIVGKRHGNVYTQAPHGVVPGRRADVVDRPFPNKPVSHRRPLNSTTQVSLVLYDFEKITITKQPRGPLSPQDCSSGIGDTTGSQQHARRDSHRPPRGELQMAREIHAKELMLQKKLCRVEEKIRQRIQEDSVDNTAGDDQKSGEERPDRGQARERRKTQTKTRLSEQQRSESVRSREIMRERRQEDVKQLRKRQDQRNEHRMRNTHEEERARSKGREIKVAQSPQLRRKGCKGTHEVIVHGQEVSGDLNKLRWENVKERTRRKGEGDKDNGMWGETDVKAKEEQNATSVGEKGWTREKKFRERTYKEMYSSDNERDMPQTSQQKMSHRAATENHTGAGRKLSVEPPLPPVSSSSHSRRPEQGEDRPIGSTYDGLQLLPCRICHRMFVSKRLEVHVQICTKTKQSHRQVFNSYVNRTKGSAIEEFWKSHSRTKTPEVLKKKKLNQ